MKNTARGLLLSLCLLFGCDRLSEPIIALRGKSAPTPTPQPAPRYLVSIQLYTWMGTPYGFGNGFVVDKKHGIIATARHVIEGPIESIDIVINGKRCSALPLAKSLAADVGLLYPTDPTCLEDAGAENALLEYALPEISSNVVSSSYISDNMHETSMPIFNIHECKGAVYDTRAASNIFPDPVTQMQWHQALIDRMTHSLPEDMPPDFFYKNFIALFNTSYEKPHMHGMSGSPILNNRNQTICILTHADGQLALCVPSVEIKILLGKIKDILQDPKRKAR